ncbi:MAG: 2Fe-2S iron-sulfur cluster-binding protein [Actinomycetota bacterium]
MATQSVAVSPHGWQFEVKDGETVLDAALRQGVAIKYGCRHGNCSTCKYLVEDGEVDFGAASPYSLPERERAEGYALLCCAQPLTDLDIVDDSEVDDRQREILPIIETVGSVHTVSRLSEDLWELCIELPEPLTFYAGQFVELEVPGRAGHWRSYSIASPPTDATRLSFVVKRIEGGAFSDQVASLKPGTGIHLRGPYGTSYVRDGDRSVVLVATGSGIAHVLSILQNAADEGDHRSFTFYYGARTRADLVKVDLLEELKDKIELRVVDALSQPTSECQWNEKPGRVTQSIQADLSDASELDAYLCGKPEMCDTIGTLLEAKGTRSSRIFFDKFYAASP